VACGDSIEQSKVDALSEAGDGNERQLRSELDARVEVGTWTHSKGGTLKNQKRNVDNLKKTRGEKKEVVKQLDVLLQSFFF
jgi:hypothetical protein